MNIALAFGLGVFLILAGHLPAPGAEMVTVTKADSGKEITVKPGDIIRIELEEVGAAGYLWQFDSLDREFFDLVHLETEPYKKGVIGGPVRKSWHLKAKKAGHTTIRMSYLRPWEDKAKAADRFILPVQIK